MPLGNLQNLQKFRRIGDGKYHACCPAHADKGPSLSIRELPDGRVLLHCFAGCGVDEILAATGMTIHDLMPERIDGHMSPVKAPFPASQGLKTLSFEASVLIESARKIHNGARLTLSERDRVKAAKEKIEEVLGYCIS